MLLLKTFTAARKKLEIHYLAFFFKSQERGGDRRRGTMKEETFWSWLRAVRLSRQLIPTVYF
jgi:hypothetical protein